MGKALIKMAKTTKHGGASNKDVVISTVTHPKRIRDEEPETEEFQASTKDNEETDYNEWTATELRDELAGRQLATSGKKSDLIERLQASDAELDEDTMDDEDEE
jgi:hypothetical protein